MCQCCPSSAGCFQSVTRNLSAQHRQPHGSCRWTASLRSTVSTSRRQMISGSWALHDSARRCPHAQSFSHSSTSQSLRSQCNPLPAEQQASKPVTGAHQQGLQVWFVPDYFLVSHYGNSWGFVTLTSSGAITAMQQGAGRTGRSCWRLPGQLPAPSGPAGPVGGPSPGCSRTGPAGPLDDLRNTCMAFGECWRSYGPAGLRLACWSCKSVITYATRIGTTCWNHRSSWLCFASGGTEDSGRGKCHRWPIKMTGQNDAWN